MSGTFFAGASRVDITPTDLSRVYLAGFGNDRKADRVLDPLHARVLYLREGDEEFALVMLDLIGVQGPDNRRLREAAGDPPASRVWVACTHSHQGPDTLGLWGKAAAPGLPIVSGIDRRYMSSLASEVAYAVRRAKRRARPSTVAWAVDRTDKSEWTWNVRDGRWFDHDLWTLIFRDASRGDAIAVLSNYGSHPEYLWSANTGVSPDWVVGLHKVIEKEIGGVSIFANGALGAMVTPGIAEETGLDERLERYTHYGRRIGQMAVAAAANATPIASPSLRVRERDIVTPLDNVQLRFISSLGVFDRPWDWQGVRTSVGLVEIGPLRLVGAPGEVCPEFGLALKAVTGRERTMLVSLCNDELGYLMPASYFDDDNYHYERTVSPGPRTAGVISAALAELAAT